MIRRQGRRSRPLWRTLLDAAVFVAVAAAVLYNLKLEWPADLGSGQTRVIDGDTLKRGKVSIRLHGIDAPERRQICQDDTGRDWACGREATEALRRLVGTRDASCTQVTR